MPLYLRTLCRGYFTSLLINNKGICKSDYLEFQKKGMLVLHVLKYTRSNPVTRGRKCQRFEAARDFICTDFYQNRKEAMVVGLLLTAVQGTVSFLDTPF